ncbi:hypothetical protein DKP78_12160 [Enterococcus faecium]|nr:hypothetical protein DKP78_12160 [Enterococcus faecium]
MFLSLFTIFSIVGTILLFISLIKEFKEINIIMKLGIFLIIISELPLLIEFFKGVFYGIIQK